MSESSSKVTSSLLVPLMWLNFQCSPHSKLTVLPISGIPRHHSVRSRRSPVSLGQKYHILQIIPHGQLIENTESIDVEMSYSSRLGHSNRVVLLIARCVSFKVSVVKAELITSGSYNASRQWIMLILGRGKHGTSRCKLSTASLHCPRKMPNHSRQIPHITESKSATPMLGTSYQVYTASPRLRLWRGLCSNSIKTG